MAGKPFSVKGLLADFLISILPKVGEERTREGLINLHRLVSGNTASMASNLGGGRRGYLALTIKSAEYTAHIGFTFMPPHNKGN